VWALISLGASAKYAGSLGRARTILDESLALSGEVGYREGVAWSLDQLGVLTLREGDAGRARRLLRRSLEVHRDLGDRWRAASVLEGLAEALGSKDTTSARRASWARRTASARPSAPPSRPANAPSASAPKAPSAYLWATLNSRGCGMKVGL
jgi:hypothetical protein